MVRKRVVSLPRNGMVNLKRNQVVSFNGISTLTSNDVFDMKVDRTLNPLAGIFTVSSSTIERYHPTLFTPLFGSGAPNYVSTPNSTPGVGGADRALCLTATKVVFGGDVAPSPNNNVTLGGFIFSQIYEPHYQAGFFSKIDRFDASFKQDLTATNTLPAKSALVRKNPFKTERTLKVFPNPTSSQVFIELPYKGTYRIEIVNLLGETIQSETGLNDSVFKLVELDLSAYSSGVYLVRISVAGNFVQTGKIVLER